MQPMHNIPARGGINYDESPFLAIWEVTQSCDLACKHCRAAAQPIPHPDELTHDEGKALIDQIADMHIPIFVFTGGDPLKRKDVFELIRYAAGKGVQVAVTPSATPLLDREAIFKMKEAGVVRLGISLDGSTPEIHDAFRGLPGAWARTIQAIEWANEAGIPIQVHTTISRHNVHDLDNLCDLFEKLAIVMWNVFFLVPVGRGQLDDLLSGEEFEQVFGKIYELSQPRQLPDQDHRGHALPPLPAAAQPGRAQNGHGHSPGSGHPGSRARFSRATDHGAAAAYEPGAPTADATTRTKAGPRAASTTARASSSSPTSATSIPAAFCPSTPATSAKRRSPRSTATRPSSSPCATPARLEGKCGACEFKEICGGSRARAYAVTGDPLAQEPCCIYQPKNWDPELEQQAEAFSHPGRAGDAISGLGRAPAITRLRFRIGED